MRRLGFFRCLGILLIGGLLATSLATPAGAEFAAPGEGPDAPTGLNATYANDAVTLTWDDPDDDTITTYGVWRRDADDYGTLVYDIVSGNIGVAFHWVDTDVEADMHYGYTVMARSSAGWSGPSNEVLVRTSPTDTTGVEQPASPLDPDKIIEPPVVVWPEGTTDLGDFTRHDSQRIAQGSVEAGSGDLLYGFTISGQNRARHVTLTLTQSPVVVQIALEQLDGTVLEELDSPSDGDQIARALRSGAYVVRLTPLSQATEGDWRLSLLSSGHITEEMLGEDLPADTTSLARMQVGSYMATRLCSPPNGDNDWIGVWLENGNRYTVTVNGASMVRKIIDPSGADHNVPSDFRQRDNYWRFQARETGVHFLQMQTWGGDRTCVVPSTTGVGIAFTADDVGGTRATAGSISVGESVTGSIDWFNRALARDDELHLFDRCTGWGIFDCDWWAAELTAGRLYKIDFQPAIVGGWASLGSPSMEFPRGPNGKIPSWWARPAYMEGGYGRELYFGPTETGTYYLPMTTSHSWNARLGGYRLSLTDVSADYEIPADRSTTSRVVPDGPAVENLFENYLDEDWHRVSMEAGTSYRIEATGKGLPAAILGIRYEDETRISASQSLIREGCTSSILAQLTNLRNLTGPAHVVFTPTQSGDYFVALGTAAIASPVGPFRGRSGPYEVSVSVVETLDSTSFGAVVAGVPELSVDSVSSQSPYVARTATDPPGDGDAWFKVSLDADSFYDTEFTELADSEFHAALFYRRGVYDSSGNILARSSEWGPFSPPTSGDHFVRVGYCYRHGEGRWFKQDRSFPDSFPVSVRVVGAEAPAVPEVQKSAEELVFESRSETDTAVLEVGVAQQVGAVGESSVGGTPVEVSSGGGWGRGGGVVSVSLRGVGGGVSRVSSSKSGARVSVQSVSGDGVGAGSGVGGRSVSGDGGVSQDSSSKSGLGSLVTSGVGELDWFMVSLTGGGTYWVELLGGEHFGDRLGAPEIRAVYDESGTVSYWSDDYSDFADDPLRRFRLTPEQDTTYYIAVSSNGDEYAITVVDATPSPTDAPADPATTTAELGVGIDERVIATIDSGSDVDCYAVELAGDVEIRFDMEGASDRLWLSDGSYVAIGTLFDPEIDGIWDPQGRLIEGTHDPAGNDAGYLLDSRLTFTPPLPGVYTICVSSDGNWQGSYRLSAMQAGQPEGPAAPEPTTVTWLSAGSQISVYAGDYVFRPFTGWFVVVSGSGQVILANDAPLDTDAGLTLTIDGHWFAIADAIDKTRPDARWHSYEWPNAGLRRTVGEQSTITLGPSRHAN